MSLGAGGLSSRLASIWMYDGEAASRLTEDLIREVAELRQRLVQLSTRIGQIQATTERLDATIRACRLAQDVADDYAASLIGAARGRARASLAMDDEPIGPGRELPNTTR